MMTKKTTVTQVQQPSDITIHGPMLQALQTATVLCRIGYMNHPDVPMTVFPTTGQVSIPLVLGSPAQHYVDAAAAATKEAADRQHAVYLRDVEEAAARQIDAAAKAEAAAKQALLIAAQKAQLAALEASFAQ